MSGSTFIQRGFTLLETIVLIVVVSAAASGLFVMYGQTSTTLITNENVQTAAQLVQQCSERVFAFRRDGNTTTRGYNNVTTAICDGLPLPAGYTRTVTLTTITGAAPCPITTPATNCRRVDVVVSRGTPQAQATFLLVED